MRVNFIKILISGHNRQRGYIALMSVIIVTGFLILIVVSSNLLSVSESYVGLEEKKFWEVSYLSDACANEALFNLKNDLHYLGDETLELENGDCIILPVEGLGNENRVIKFEVSANNRIRRVRIEILKIDPKMEIGAWQEVLEF